mgnify:CR=1 FL=1
MLAASDPVRPSSRLSLAADGTIEGRFDFVLARA